MTRCSNPAHPIPRAPPTQCGSPRQSSPPAIGHVNMFETSQLAQDGHSKSIKIDQNPKDSTLPSNVRMIWAMAILWIVWDLSLFRDLHRVLGGLPWPTVAYRGLPSSWAVWQLLPFQLQFPASGSPIWTEDGLVFKWCKNVKKCCEYKKWIQGKRWKWWK